MRVLVCGGRDYGDAGIEMATIRLTLLALHEGPDGPITHLFHGNARGADSEAARLCRDFRIPTFACPANWKKHGKRAGPIRNQNMLGNQPDIVVAFPGGRGTADMVRRAKSGGFRVIEIQTIASF